jgi:alkylated DNA repair dioxygenase AlkB
MLDLFADAEPWQEPLAPGAVILRRFALSRAAALLAGIEEVTAVSPFRHMVTPGGYTMSVAMTNCGELGWATNERGICMLRTIPRPASRGLRCLRFFRHFATRLPWRRIILTSVRMPA